MSQTLKLPNFHTNNIVETSVLDADAAIATTSLAVRFSDQMTTDGYLFIGEFGGEGSELAVLNTITDADTVTIDAPGLVKAHKRFEPATILFGNKLRIYRASNVDGTTPADGDFSLLDTIDIDVDQAQTTYEDATGGSDYWYKYIYYNSVLTSGTNIADATAVRGGSIGNYASIESIRREAGLQNNKYIADDFIDEKRQAAQQVINSTLSGIYTIPFTAPINPGIAEVTRLLAAGYLLTANYGALNTLNTNEGEAKIKRAMDMLAGYRNGSSQVVDETGTTIALPGTAGGFGGWPNSTTATAAPTEGGATRAFRMSDKY